MIGFMIFLSSFLDDANMSLQTVSFLAQLGSDMIWASVHIIDSVRTVAR